METIVISFVMMAIAIAIIVWAMNVFAKAERLRDEAKAETESAREEIESLNEQLKAKDKWTDYLVGRINGNDSQIKELGMQIPLFRLPLRFEIKEAPKEYCIHVFYPTRNETPEVELPIKSFPKGDDEDFALREAQELLEHLNEK